MLSDILSTAPEGEEIRVDPSNTHGSYRTRIASALQHTLVRGSESQISAIFNGPRKQV
jgi:hypothetical protein